MKFLRDTYLNACMFSRRILDNGILLYDVPDKNFHQASERTSCIFFSFFNNKVHFDLSSTNAVTFQKYITEVNFKRGY